jgi:hypothetical protein
MYINQAVTRHGPGIFVFADQPEKHKFAIHTTLTI